MGPGKILPGPVLRVGLSGERICRMRFPRFPVQAKTGLLLPPAAGVLFSEGRNHPMSSPSGPPAGKKPPRRFGEGPYKGRTIRQHIMRRLLLVVPISVLMIVLARTGAMDRVVDHYTFKPMSWFDNTALVQHLRVTVTHNGMTGDRPECLLFVVDGDSPPTATKIDVLEKHSGSCPNPDKSLPKLFTLRVNRPAQLVETDQGTPDSFHPIP